MLSDPKTLRVVLLGSAAGGGFPQWNCSCGVCSVARRDAALAHPRTQSSVAIRSSAGKWFLVNVSPDVHSQLERQGIVPPTAIEAALVTNADLDHTLGLFLLREGEPLRVVCRPAVRTALGEGLGLDKVLARYCGVQWIEAPFEDQPLLDRKGGRSGLTFRAIRANGNPPRYFEAPRSVDRDDSVGYRIEDMNSGKSVLVLPDVEHWTELIESECAASTLVLFDGTFWSENELSDVRPGARAASQMGHLPISGPGGSLLHLAKCPAEHKVYVHLNNTNPILLEDSAERSEVQGCGIGVGDDGMTWDL